MKWSSVSLRALILSLLTIMPAAAEMSAADIEKTVRKANVLAPNIRVSGINRGPEVILSVYAAVSETDLKIESVLIAREFFSVDSSLTRTTVNFYDPLKPENYCSVSVRSSDVKAFASGLVKQEELLTGLTVDKRTRPDEKQVSQEKRVSQEKQGSPVQTISGKNRPIRDKWAVIVGVGNFKDPTIPKLKYPAKDARDFYNYLVTKANFQPDHVRLLLNEKATRERIWTEIGDVFLPRVVSPDDLVVLYFSTHGSPAEKDVRQSSYLIAYDTRKNRLHADGIEMPALLEELNKRTGADRILIVLDACHSGAADPHAKALDFHSEINLDQLAVGQGNIVLSSSQPQERSWESPRCQNGIFTRKLIDCLSKNPKVIQSFSALKDAVSDEVRQEYGQRQVPRLKSDGWEGDDLLLSAPVLKRTVISPTVKGLLEPDSKDPAIVKPVVAPQKR